MNRGWLTALVLCMTAVTAVNAGTGLKREFEKTVPLRSGGSVELKNVTGPATVTGWDREEVRVRAVITCNRELSEEKEWELFDKIAVIVDHDWNKVRIKTKYPNQDWDGGKPDFEDPDFDLHLGGDDSENNSFAQGILALVGEIIGGVTGWVSGLVEEHLPVSVSYDVFVPRRCDLELKTVTGDLLVTGLDGTVETGLVTGTTSLVDVTGRIDCNTVTGNIEIENGAGKISTSLINGQATISLAGDGEFNGLDCNLINGGVVVRLPQLEAFDYDIKAINGQIVFDTDMFKGKMNPGSNETGSVNGGGPPINIKAINGSIRLESAVR